MSDFLRNRSILLASVLLLAQSAVYYSISVKEYIPAIQSWSEFPSEIDHWQKTSEIPVEPEVVAALQPDDYLNRTYVSKKQDAAVSLLVVYFNTRRSGHAPHSPQWCLPGAGWQDVSNRVVNLTITGRPDVQKVNEYILQKGETKLFVVYWYHQGTRVVSNEVLAQFYALPEMILHGRTDTALVRVIAPFTGADIDRARTKAFQFARDIFPLVLKQIQ